MLQVKNLILNIKFELKFSQFLPTQQLATPLTFGANVNLVRYEEAEEIDTATAVFAGWGGTLVIHLENKAILNDNN